MKKLMLVSALILIFVQNNLVAGEHNQHRRQEPPCYKMPAFCIDTLAPITVSVFAFFRILCYLEVFHECAQPKSF